MSAGHVAGIAGLRRKQGRPYKTAVPAWQAVFVAPMLLAALAGCAPKPRIAGIINTTEYVIKSGHVVTAVGDVTIIASHRIEIYGVLEVAHGATVRFKSPIVNISGKVEYEDKYVGWWLRSKFLLNRLPEMVTAALDRTLGRTPNYWARGALDCSSPLGGNAALSAAPRRQGRREPGWRWKKRAKEPAKDASPSDRKS